MWDLRIIDTDQSLYIAIADAMQRDINLGKLLPGERLPTHRQLAKTVGVNVTTVTRAYKEAERRGLIVSTVGSGTFVSPDLGRSSTFFGSPTTASTYVEMGMVLPMHYLEPDIRDLLQMTSRKTDWTSFMAYTPPEGCPAHRATGAKWMRELGYPAHPEQVIVTAGVQHALMCVLSSIFSPGDAIAVDQLTYPAFKSAAARCGLRLEPVSMDAEGMCPIALTSLVNRVPIKGIYTVSVMQNPTTAQMTTARRAAIIDIIRRHDLVLLEDDIYRFMAIDPVAPLSADIPEQSIYFAGVSKAFYAGLRIAFLASPQKYYARIAQGIVDTMWMAPALNAELVCNCIESGLSEKIIEIKRAEIRKRAGLLAKYFSGMDYSYASDSMFVWLRLPKGRNAREFEKESAELGVHLVAAEEFAVGHAARPDAVRISLTGAEDYYTFEHGLDVVKRLLNQEIHPVGSIL
ncbi:MAG: PLP-dependent aminotransferase family protein [Clostridiaceae bacterium]|nr:PLP-dependent aminotransferase family protein [Clostridiaceae bacterium]